MNFGLARTAQIAGWQSYGVANARRAGTASTNASQTWTASGAVTSTAQFQFGTASEYVSTNANEIYTSSGTPTFMDYGTGEFTIEWWMWFDMLSGHTLSCDILSNNVTGGLGMRCAQAFDSEGLSSANPKYFNVFARNQADLDYWTLPGNWPVNQWVFCSMQRKGTDMCFWLNGQLCTRTTAGGGAGTRYFQNSTSATDVRIGRANGAAGIAPGYIDELCFSNTYRYDNITQNIPVPYQPFTVDSFTSQLLHMDGANTGTIFTNALT
jgi:hypothetical protein